MEIVRTLAEAKAVTQGAIVTLLNLKKKKSVSDIHEGYNRVLSHGRTFGNKTIVGFWYDTAILNYLDYRFPSESSLDWDRDGCIAWAESQNVDVVWAPDYQDEISTYNISNINYYRNLIDRIWGNEQYEQYFINSMLSDRTKLLCLAKLFNKTNWKSIYSNKDGVAVYIEADFSHKYTNERVIILDPVKATDNLYYSSSYFKYTEAEKSELVKIEQAVLSSNLSGRDPVGVVADAIRAAITNPSFVLQGANVTSDARFLGPSKKIIDIKFHIGTGENLKYDHYAFLV